MRVIEYINEYLRNINKSYSEEKDIVCKLLSSIYEVNPLEFIIKYGKNDISDNDKKKFRDILDKYYIHNIPLVYITGLVNFYHESYIVNESVLIPRPDTECLVQKAIEYIEKEKIESILDMCTGSGAIRNIYPKKF